MQESLVPSAPDSSQPARAVHAARWVIGPRADLLWLVGGTGWGLLLWLAFGRWSFELAPLWFAWMVLLNGPHFFATWSRTYLVAEEWRVRGRLLSASLALLLLGPALLLLERAVLGAPSPARSPLPWYFALVSTWGYWHVVRQHQGVLRLYQRRGGGQDARDFRLEQALLYLGLLAPFLWLLSVHPDVREGLALPPVEADPLLVRVLRGGLGLAAVAVAAAFLARQLYQRWRGRPLPTVRLLFLGAVVGYYAWVCTRPELLRWPLFIVTPLLVVPHDVQYHALVWFYQRNQRRQALERGARPALGVRIATVLPAYAAVGLVLGALMALAGCSVDRALHCAPAFYDSTPGWLGFTPRELLFAAFHAVLVHHYFIDSFIWRPGREARVARGLGLGLT